MNFEEILRKLRQPAGVFIQFYKLLSMIQHYLYETKTSERM